MLNINTKLKQVLNNTKLLNSFGNLYKFNTSNFCLKMNVNEMDLINFSNKSFKTKHAGN